MMADMPKWVKLKDVPGGGRPRSIQYFAAVDLSAFGDLTDAEFDAQRQRLIDAVSGNAVEYYFNFGRDRHLGEGSFFIVTGTNRSRMAAVQEALSVFAPVITWFSGGD
jgi:hypothetical protein